MEESADISTLVERIKEGDREAFMTVTRLYQRKVFLLAYSFFRNREDALDIVQETFFKVYQKVRLFERGEGFQNWLLQIAKNLCIDYYRKSLSRGKDEWSEKSFEEVNAAVGDERNPHAASDLRMIISECIQKLAKKQRMVFVMKHYNQLNYAEIAQILGISLGTAKSLHFKAVQNIRSLMAPYLGRSHEKLQKAKKKFSGFPFRRASGK